MLEHRENLFWMDHDPKTLEISMRKHNMVRNRHAQNFMETILDINWKLYEIQFLVDSKKDAEKGKEGGEHY